jgi:hypothetical protein
MINSNSVTGGKRQIKWLELLAATTFMLPITPLGGEAKVTVNPQARDTQTLTHPSPSNLAPTATDKTGIYVTYISKEFIDDTKRKRETGAKLSQTPKEPPVVIPQDTKTVS